MPTLCPSCERVPGADAVVGSPCASCGTPLTKVGEPAALELEPQWRPEKQDRQAAATRAGDRQKRPLKIFGVVAAVIAVAIVATGVVMIVNHDPAPRTRLPVVTEGTVSLEVRSNPPVQIRVDGHNAGKTPLTLHMPKSTKPVMFEAVVKGRPITRQVIPDRDQMVDFVP